MPHTRSAKKNLRKSEKRRLHNRQTKRTLKTENKKFLSLVESGSVEELRAEYDLASRKLDKAASRHIIHPNLAARKKSQMARDINKKLQGKAAPAAAKK